MIVQSVMTENPVCCAMNTPLNEVAKLMLDFDCGAIPVVGENGSRKPLGVITDRDIATRVVARGHDPKEVLASDCMTSPCITVTTGTSLKALCQLMEISQIRRVAVVDANGDVCGIVSLADVTRSATPIVTAEVVKEVSATH
jgi:CBS domain-containing protein